MAAWHGQHGHGKGGMCSMVRGSMVRVGLCIPASPARAWQAGKSTCTGSLERPPKRSHGTGMSGEGGMAGQRRG
eukprot:364219-Chlamydomonas_euryale.AAC.4